MSKIRTRLGLAGDRPQSIPASEARILVAGVGRSGTSTLFTELASSMRARFKDNARYFYEPYLWEVAGVNRSGDIDAGAFNTDGFSAFGVHVHTSTPLFLHEGGEPEHEKFVRHLYGPAQPTLVKAIRANGRLRHYLGLIPDLKVVAIVRNPLDTINSALNHFSLLGDDFHKSDKHRLGEELKVHFPDIYQSQRLSKDSGELLWSVAWWEFMTRSVFDALHHYPDRVLVLEYDSFRSERNRAREAMSGFLGLRMPSRKDSAKSVGITTAQNFLGEGAQNYLEPYHRWYLSEIRKAHENVFVTDDIADLLSDEAMQSKFSRPHESPALAQFPLKRTTVGWRMYGVQREKAIVRMREAFARSHDDRRLAGQVRREALVASDSSAPFDVSVIIPFKNAQKFLDRAVVSVIDQKSVNAQVVLIDDASDDGSVEIANQWARHKQVKLLTNKRNCGPGYSRHRGVLAADSDFVTTLDADDEYHAHKLRSELDALNGDRRSVAFSGVEYITRHDISTWRYSQWPSRDPKAALSYTLSRADSIPRDFTLSRDLYFRSGGFEVVARCYEDWSFKLRLATVAKSWIFTEQVGLVYNRGDGGLSGGDKYYHLFYLVYNYLRNAKLIYQQLGSRSVPLLKSTIAAIKTPHRLNEVFDLLMECKGADAEFLQIVQNMEKVAGRLIFQNSLSYEDRLDVLVDSAFV